MISKERFLKQKFTDHANQKRKIESMLFFSLKKKVLENENEFCLKVEEIVHCFRKFSIVYF